MRTVEFPAGVAEMAEGTCLVSRRRKSVGGSNPLSSSNYVGAVAQLGEHLVCNQDVGGSSPLPSTKFVMGRRLDVNSNLGSRGGAPASGAPSQCGLVAEGFSTGLKSRGRWVDSIQVHQTGV